MEEKRRSINVPISVDIDGLVLPGKASPHETVEQTLRRLDIAQKEGDILTPPKEARIAPHTIIHIASAKKYSLKTKEGRKIGKTTLRTVGQLLDEAGISPGSNDLIEPNPDSPLVNDTEITVTKVDIQEETVTKSIPFETKEVADQKLSWRKRIVSQRGEDGIRKLVYETISHDGKIIKKSLKKSEIFKDPVSEVVTQGTKVEVGKTHTGLGSWYRFTGTLSAANPWLPIGSHVRVTNKDNGKSVIVRINDRGPFGKNRIIDLDAVAFEKISSLGAGIINVTVEEITN